MGAAVGLLLTPLPSSEAAPVPKSMKKPPRPLHPSVAKLIKLVPPPANPINPPTEADWADAEKELGTALPDDHKDLMTTYGEGYFSDLVIRLYSPRHTLDNLHLLANQRGYREGYHDAVGTPLESYNIPIVPDDGGYLFVANCATGQAFGYHPSGPPNTWPVFVYEWRGLREDRHNEWCDVGLAELLLEFAEGRSSCSLGRCEEFLEPMVFHPFEPTKK